MSEKNNNANHPQIKVVNEGFYGDDVSISFSDYIKSQSDNKDKPENQNDKKPADAPQQ